MAYAVGFPPQTIAFGLLPFGLLPKKLNKKLSKELSRKLSKELCRKVKRGT